MPTLPEVRVGDPIRHEALTVFPLFSPPDGHVEYLLADEAIAAGSVTVEEVSEGGSVPNLLVSNTGDSRVLFLEGEELRGAKQNRVLNTSVLVAARSKTPIPVSCVEQGRWRYRTPPVRLGRHRTRPRSCGTYLKESVTRSLKAGRGHASDQGAVWGEVGRQMASLGSSSETAAMADTYEAYQGRLDEFRERLQYVEGATGLAVAVGPKVVAVDLFDKPSTCRKVWDRLLSGVVMDALEAGQPEAGRRGRRRGGPPVPAAGRRLGTGPGGRRGAGIPLRRRAVSPRLVAGPGRLGAPRQRGRGELSRDQGPGPPHPSGRPVSNRRPLKGGNQEPKE